MNEFNTIEKDVLSWFITKHAGTALSVQLETARFLSRKYTGVGFYVNFMVDHSTRPSDVVERNHKWPLDGPVIVSEEIEHNGTVLLWGDAEGYANCIEMVAFGDNFKESITTFELVSNEEFNQRVRAQHPPPN